MSAVEDGSQSTSRIDWLGRDGGSANASTVGGQVTFPLADTAMLRCCDAGASSCTQEQQANHVFFLELELWLARYEAAIAFTYRLAAHDAVNPALKMDVGQAVRLVQEARC